MRWPWQRKESSDRDVDVLFAQASVAAPTGPFRMVVDDVFSITGRGTVATGRIDTGGVRVGQEIRIVRAGTVLTTTTVTGVEMFREVLEVAAAGDSVGLLLQGVTGENVMREDVLES